MWMTKFDKYSGLFADQGSFDIPASITAGVAYDINTRLTVMADFQRIFYSGVGAVSNSSINGLQFGSTGGPGFGWHDVNVYKVGVEYRMNDMWTLRAGYAYSDNPVQPADVMLNILAPGVVTHHFTTGATYKMSKQDFAGLRLRLCARRHGHRDDAHGLWRPDGHTPHAPVHRAGGLDPQLLGRTCRQTPMRARSPDRARFRFRPASQSSGKWRRSGSPRQRSRSRARSPAGRAGVAGCRRPCPACR